MIQIYTGRGKGKTTAAMGLALRALGAGLKVLIIQFIKSGDSSEFKALANISENLKVIHCGRGKFLRGKAGNEDKILSEKAIAELKSALLSKSFDVIILDEVIPVISHNLINEDNLIKLLTENRNCCEFVLTGRGADEKLIEIADLVTEMNEIKHYYKKGVKARLGIEY